MILSDQCWLKQSCKKFIEGQCGSNTFCIKLFKLNQLYDLTLLSYNQRAYKALYIDEDRSDEQAFLKLKSVQENIEEFIHLGSNLYLYSNICGNGKTEWAVRLIQTHINNIWAESDIRCRALFISVPRFLISLKDNISQRSDYINHIKENILSADVVVWDEIASKGFTEFEMENIFNLINMRIDQNKSNIFTSNIFGEELKQRVGERLYSRICNLSECIELKGKDKRGGLI